MCVIQHSFGHATQVYALMWSKTFIHINIESGSRVSIKLHILDVKQSGCLILRDVFRVFHSKYLLYSPAILCLFFLSLFLLLSMHRIVPLLILLIEARRKSLAQTQTLCQFCIHSLSLIQNAGKKKQQKHLFNASAWHFQRIMTIHWFQRFSVTNRPRRYLLHCDKSTCLPFIELTIQIYPRDLIAHNL